MPLRFGQLLWVEEGGAGQQHSDGRGAVLGILEGRLGQSSSSTSILVSSCYSCFSSGSVRSSSLLSAPPSSFTVPQQLKSAQFMVSMVFFMIISILSPTFLIIFLILLVFSSAKAFIPSTSFIQSFSKNFSIITQLSTQSISDSLFFRIFSALSIQSVVNVLEYIQSCSRKPLLISSCAWLIFWVTASHSWMIDCISSQKNMQFSWDFSQPLFMQSRSRGETNLSITHFLWREWNSVTQNLQSSRWSLHESSRQMYWMGLQSWELSYQQQVGLEL